MRAERRCKATAINRTPFLRTLRPRRMPPIRTKKWRPLVRAAFSPANGLASSDAESAATADRETLTGTERKCMKVRLRASDPLQQVPCVAGSIERVDDSDEVVCSKGDVVSSAGSHTIPRGDRLAAAAVARSTSRVQHRPCEVSAHRQLRMNERSRVILGRVMRPSYDALRRTSREGVEHGVRGLMSQIAVSPFEDGIGGRKLCT